MQQYQESNNKEQEEDILLMTRKDGQLTKEEKEKRLNNNMKRMIEFGKYLQRENKLNAISDINFRRSNEKDDEHSMSISQILTQQNPINFNDFYAYHLPNITIGDLFTIRIKLTQKEKKELFSILEEFIVLQQDDRLIDFIEVFHRAYNIKSETLSDQLVKPDSFNRLQDQDASQIKFHISGKVNYDPSDLKHQVEDNILYNKDSVRQLKDLSNNGAITSIQAATAIKYLHIINEKHKTFLNTLENSNEAPTAGQISSYIEAISTPLPENLDKKLTNDIYMLLFKESDKMPIHVFIHNVLPNLSLQDISKLLNGNVKNKNNAPDNNAQTINEQNLVIE